MNRACQFIVKNGPYSDNHHAFGEAHKPSDVVLWYGIVTFERLSVGKKVTEYIHIVQVFCKGYW